MWVSLFRVASLVSMCGVLCLGFFKSLILLVKYVVSGVDWVGCEVLFVRVCGWDVKCHMGGRVGVI